MQTQIFNNQYYEWDGTPEGIWEATGRFVPTAPVGAYTPWRNDSFYSSIQQGGDPTKYQSYEGWGNLLNPNDPLANIIQRAQWTPEQADRYVDSYYQGLGLPPNLGGGGPGANYFNQQGLWDKLVSDGYASPSEAAAVKSQLQQRGDLEVSRDEAGHVTPKELLSAALFSIGTPLALGAGLTGISAAAGAGGGLGGSVLGAIANPAQALGVSGPLGSLVNTGIKQGLSALMDSVSNPGQRAAASSFSPAAYSTQTAQIEPPSISEAVTGPTTSSASSLSDVVTQPQNLSNAVVSYSRPQQSKRPQIRLSPGFRRGY